MKVLLELFWEMFKIAFCVIGGGYAILAVADGRFSRKKKWIEEGELVEHLPVFQMVPGIIAGSTAVYVGRKVAGVKGALAALTGVFLPSVIVFSAISAGYSLIPLDNRYLDASFLGLRAALAGIIAAMTLKAWKKSLKDALAYVFMLVSLYAISFEGMNPAFVVLLAAFAGIVLSFAGSFRGRFPKSCFFSSLWLMPLVFLKYGLIAFGGGYVLVPVYINDFVGPGALFLQLSAKEFADVMALTQMTPGPIAVNCATFFGYRLGIAHFGSVSGALACAFAATLSLLLPGFVLLYAALNSLERFRTSRIVGGILLGIKPVTIAMMLNALWAFLSIGVVEGGGAGWRGIDPVALLIFVSSACALRSGKAGAVAIILLSAGVSVVAGVWGVWAAAFVLLALWLCAKRSSKAG